MGNCLSCSQESPTTESGNAPVTIVGSSTDGRTSPETVSVPTVRKPAEVFTFKQLATATKNFKHTRLLRRGAFGPEYHGQLRNGEDVAVKRLDKIGQLGDEELFAEVENLSTLHHPNLVTFIGYCSERDQQRLLVYEYMPLGSLDRHLYDLPLEREPLDWNTRMKIGAGVAKGLEYLQVCQPEIARDLKTSNILLDEDYHPKLSECGMAKFGPLDDTIVSMQVVLGTNGYCAPEYAVTGELTPKCEVYSLGVILLEIISGRKVIDNTRSPNMRNFVKWAQPLFKDRRQFHTLVDPLLHGYFPLQGLCRAIDIAAMCLHEEADKRPVIRDVVCGLTFLESQHYDPNKSDQGGPSSSYKSNQSGSSRSFLSPSSSAATSSRKGTGSDKPQKKHYFQRGSSSSAADTGTARETQPAAEAKGQK